MHTCGISSLQNRVEGGFTGTTSCDFLKNRTTRTCWALSHVWMSHAKPLPLPPTPPTMKILPLVRADIPQNTIQYMHECPKVCFNLRRNYRGSCWEFYENDFKITISSPTENKFRGILLYCRLHRVRTLVPPLSTVNSLCSDVRYLNRHAKNS